MVYAMPGMRSTLHAVLNRPGEYEGFSANSSGAGFSHMRFKLRGVDQAGFDRWVGEAKASARTLDIASYQALEKPSEKVPVARFNGAAPGLFERVVQRCVTPGTPCVGAAHGPQHGHGAKGRPEGALLKDGSEIAPGSNITKPPSPDVPGVTQPASPKNRDMSSNTLPAASGLPAAGLG
jgi:cytochrome o ubiquinol oxidase subunit 2